MRGRFDRVSTVIRKSLKGGNIVGDNFVNSFALIPVHDKIVATATKIASIANLNHTVHLPNYHQLIGKIASHYKQDMMKV